MGSCAPFPWRRSCTFPSPRSPTAFPDYRVAFVVAEGLTIAPERPAALDALIAEREAAARATWGGTELSQIPGIAAWRAAYKGFGIKQTRYRSSVERLVKNVLAGRAARARERVRRSLQRGVARPRAAARRRRSRPRHAAARLPLCARGRQLRRHGGARRASEPEAPKPGEVVYADAAHVLCRRWNWRQDARSLITPETRRAVVTVQSNGAGRCRGRRERSG